MNVAKYLKGPRRKPCSRIHTTGVTFTLQHHNEQAWWKSAPTLTTTGLSRVMHIAGVEVHYRDQISTPYC